MHTIEGCLQPIDEPVAKDAHAGNLCRPLGVGQFKGHGCGHDSRSVVSATPTLAFLAAADDQRINLGPTVLDEHAHTLRATELVRAQRHQVDVRRHIAQVEPAHSLNGIGVNQRPGSVAARDPTDSFEIVDRTDLVVDRHDADDRDISTLELRCQVIEVDPASSINTDDDSAVMFDDFEHSVMFDGRAHRCTTKALHRTGDGHVVTFGTTPCEDHVVGTAPQHRGDAVT